MSSLRKSARTSLPGSTSTLATPPSSTTRSKHSSTASNRTTASASESPSATPARTARYTTKQMAHSISHTASASPSRKQGTNSYDDPIILSDNTDTEHETEEVVDSSDDEVTAPTALTPSPNAPKQNGMLLSPPYVNNVVERSRSTSTIDRSYATSLNSDLNHISDSTLSSLSSVDSDSDGSDAVRLLTAATKAPNRTLRPSQSSRPASTPERVTEESQRAHSQSSSSTPTPSRRSARIVSSGSSVQKAIQRRDELDAKLTASPIRRKLDSSEAPPPKRSRGRPRKSAPEPVRTSASSVGQGAVQPAASSSTHDATPSSSTRRSARLSLPSALTTADAASPAKGTTAPKQVSVLEEPSPQASVRKSVRGRRSRGNEVAVEPIQPSATSVVLSKPLPSSSAAAKSVVPNASIAASTENTVTQDTSVTPVSRGRGRPRKSLIATPASPLSSVNPIAERKQTGLTTRMRKRSFSSIDTSAGPASPSSAVTVAPEGVSNTPRRKRGRPSRTSVAAEAAVSDSAPPASPTPAHSSRASRISRQEAIDMLDDDLSELSDDSDMSIDSPAPPQYSSLARPAGRGKARPADAIKVKRATKPDKDGKSYHVTGLYAGEADAVASTSLLRPGETTNTILPMPIHFGAKLLTEERDFCLPYPIHKKMDQLRDRVNAKRKPPRYQQISKNKYFSRPKLQGEISVCNCKPGSGCGADCLNRMLMFICDPKTCPSASNCTNVSLGQRPTVKTVVSYYGRRGFGLKTLEPIKRDDFIDEYRGEVINLFEAKKRVTEEYKATGNFYLLDYDSAAGELLDGGRKGNITRFANHSCDPNCRIEKFIICGTDEALSAEFQIGLFAIRDIEAGEELTYNYGWSAFQPRDITGAPTAQVPTEKCLCGAANCSGILGGKKTPPTKAATAHVEANSRRKTAKGRGKSKGKGRKVSSSSRVRMRSMAPTLSASRLSAAAMPSAALLSTSLASTSRKRVASHATLVDKMVIKRRERSARASSQIPSPSTALLTSFESAESAAKAKDLDNDDAPRTPPATTAPLPTASRPAKAAIRSATSQTNATAGEEAAAIGTSASKQASTPQAASTSIRAKAASASATLGSSTSSSMKRLPLLSRIPATRLGNAFGRATAASRGAKGTKDRRWSTAETLIAEDDENSSVDRDWSDSEGVGSDFQKQGDGPQQHPASNKAGGKSGRRGRHKLQLSSDEVERRAAERRARNAFLARVRRASKRGIVIEDPTQHPLKKISIQCTAAPENTYIPDLPSSLVTLGMTTADARRARNAFLARVRRAVKRGYAKDVAIKMAAKPLPGDAARDTPVMKAQRAYMEQLEREAVDELSGSVGSGARDGQASLAAPKGQSAAAATAAGEDGWVDESSWAAA